MVARSKLFTVALAFLLSGVAARAQPGVAPQNANPPVRRRPPLQGSQQLSNLEQQVNAVALQQAMNSSMQTSLTITQRELTWNLQPTMSVLQQQLTAAQQQLAAVRHLTLLGIHLRERPSSCSSGATSRRGSSACCGPVCGICRRV